MGSVDGDGVADLGGDVGPLIGGDSHVGHVVDVVGLEEDGAGAGQFEVVVDDGDRGGEGGDVEGAETVDLVAGGQQGVVVPVLLAGRESSSYCWCGCIGSDGCGGLDDGFGLVVEGVAHVDTGVLEAGWVVVGVVHDVQDSCDDNADFDEVELRADGVDKHDGTSQVSCGGTTSNKSCGETSCGHGFIDVVQSSCSASTSEDGGS